MPIYEYYCPDNNTLYQFFAKSLAQRDVIPKCPDNPKFRMQKAVSAFAVKTTGKKSTTEGADVAGGNPPAPGDAAEDSRMEAAMSAMESEFANVDENDPRAMGRMMRRMAELSGEKIDGEMEEVVRKLEEGADPDALEEQLGDAFPDEGGDADPYGEGPMPGGEKADPKEGKHRYKARRLPPRRDPKLYDYE
jgi:hypothetical protein